MINFFKKNKKQLRIYSRSTISHPRWHESTHYGTNYYLLNLLPGSYRDSSGFPALYSPGVTGWYWIYNPPNSYFIYTFSYNSSVVSSVYLPQPEHGCSIRGCRDLTSVEEQYHEGTILKENYTDGEGNKYDAVKIGNRMWLNENLYSSKLQNGTVIATLNWDQNSTNGVPARCYWNNNISQFGVYGQLYNMWCAPYDIINSSGWRVSKYEDWEDLINFIDYTHGEDYEGYFLKGYRQVNHPLGNNYT